jgi:hypothetical protein
MSNQNYTLDIISHHPKFNSKSLRKYYVDGIETVGAWGDEPFEIKFKNNTWQKIQVKLSVDGTDILSGDKASTDVDKNMWVVNGYGTLSLKAWPETNNGGAAFVFTSANNSVAINTHGDMSSRGIIAAAVFVEGHVEPIRLAPIVIDNHHHYHPPVRRRTDWYGPIWTSNTIGNTLGGSTYGSNTGTVIPTSYNSTINSNTLGDAGDYKCSASMDSLELGDSDSRIEKTKGLESLVSVGAGQHVDQKITYVTGLIKPILTETVRVRYLWWDDLQAKLVEHNVPAPHASGFPGDKGKNIDLGGTPRIGSFKPAFPREQAPVYSRV